MKKSITEAERLTFIMKALVESRVALNAPGMGANGWGSAAEAVEKSIVAVAKEVEATIASKTE